MTTAALHRSPHTLAPADDAAQTLAPVRWALYVTVFLIPLEYPDRFPFEVSTIAGSCFLLLTLLQPATCYRLLPWAMVAFAAYFGVELLAFEIHLGGAVARLL